VPRAIFLSDHKATQKTAGSPIISDLHGQPRVPYKTENKLKTELEKLCREHDFTKRFEKALSLATKGLSKGDKKSSRALAIKICRALDGKTTIRRAELIQNLQAQAYKKSHINFILKRFHALDLLNCTVGKYSDVRIT
jgi:hypothetical protein